ncbi:MAG: glutamate--tRNA ligase [Candidatus Firestonebacteria bacterium]
MEEKIRVRFAPSPTGYMHIGNARTALFNFLFVRKHNGAFILRIEDTDAERSTKEAVQTIINSLNWLGLNWDEGYFGEGKEAGDYGPYTQMKRLEIYNRHINQLLKEKKAYCCFCTEEEIEEKRKIAVQEGLVYKYDGVCKNLKNEEIERYKKEKKYVVRFNVPARIIEFEDLIRGTVQFDSKEIGDFVIARGDGVPIYNFAVVIDDALMKITHVIRGEDHLSNTPRQVLIYKALNFSIPKFAHLPMILGPDRTKLSKRHGETSLLSYKEKGYLPSALFNYLTLLGWYPRDGVEIKSKEQIINEFDIKDVGHSGGIFDEKKLMWMNSEYIKKLSIGEILNLANPYIDKSKLAKSDEWWKMVLESVRTSINYLSEIPSLISIYFEPDKIKEEDLKIINTDSAKNVLKVFKEILQNNEITKDNFKILIQEISKKTGAKGKDLYMPIRIGITGNNHGPELMFVLPILGSKECIRRIETTVLL